VGLIGGPRIKQYSIADLVWRRISSHAKVQFEYEMWPVSSKGELETLVRSLMASDRFLGCNIALPWKAEIVQYSTSQDQFVSATGLANSLGRSNGGFVAFNTDPAGCHEGMIEYGFGEKGEKVLILGAGGAGTALAVHLAQQGHTIVTTDIVSWKAERAENLGKLLNLDIHSVGPSMVHHYVGDADVIVNATDVGKVMDRDRGVFPTECPIDCDLLRNSPAHMVVEMNYLPIKTQLLRQAERFDKVVVPGIEMLVRQAVSTFNVVFETQLSATSTDRIVSELRGLLTARRILNSYKRALKYAWNGRSASVRSAP
jgi:shikimate dehydrogenase